MTFIQLKEPCRQSCNSLAVKSLLLVKEWHPFRNSKLTPYDVLPSAGKKVWWKCPKGDDHEWQATINHRTNGTGCPKCNPAYSIPELRIFSELKAIFQDMQHRAIIQNREIDIYIPKFNIGIEFDGVYWHQDKHEKDLEKDSALNSIICLIRVREDGLPLLSSNDIRVKKRDINFSTIKDILKIIFKYQNKISRSILEKIDKYMLQSDLIASSYFNNLYFKRKHVAFEKSLSFLFPDIAKELHHSQNDLLLSEYFSPGSGRNIWWKGSCGHEWQESINHRTSGRGCPQCRYKRAKITRCKR